MTRSAATVRAYRSDWAAFASWCDTKRLASRPASAGTVARYVDHLADRRSVATVRRRLAAVRAQHFDHGQPSPTDTAPVRLAVARAEWRQRDRATTTTPLSVADVRAISRALPDTVAGARDRAVLLLGYGAGLRPGELVRLDVAHVRRVRAGLRVDVGRRPVIVPFGSANELCAVDAWVRWRRAAPLGPGPAFRAVDRHGHLGEERLSAKAITRIVRRAAARASLDSTLFRGSSLRRGTVVAASEHGASDAGIMAHTRHRSRRLVRRYMEGNRPPGTTPSAAR
ncbi:MAG TPA: tyrosine-type recombinase/integrase [Acidimicrobiia bacterium]|nr:tyrosine-type recombinase/integrase [Acidimicrobiia bacterium]